MRGQQLATSYIVSTSDKSDQIIQFLSLPAKANSVTDQWTLKTIELVLSIFSVSVCVFIIENLHLGEHSKSLGDIPGRDSQSISPQTIPTAPFISKPG